MKRFKNERAVVSLEASIVVTIFLFLMLFLYSFFVVFEARNNMAHVLLATTDSLSKDPYESGKHSNSGNLSQILYGLFQISDEPSADGFTSTKDWSNIPGFGFDETGWDGTIYVDGSAASLLAPDEFGNSATTSSALSTAIEERFLAYLAEGSLSQANDILDRFHIKGGWNGLDFSGSKISGGKLYIKVRYTIEYEFNFFGLGELELEQSACSKIWK